MRFSQLPRCADGLAGGVRINQSLLLLEIRQQGYPGSRAQLERLLWEWRRDDALPAAQLAVGGTHQMPESMTAMPPITASILCTTPRGRLTERQASRVDLLKERLSGFADMRQLAMRFGGILRGNNPATLDAWLADVRRSGFSALSRFAQVLSRDIDAVRYAIRVEWSNGQTEGQINKLKALKRSMYGQAGAELLRARMLPITA